MNTNNPLLARGRDRLETKFVSIFTPMESGDPLLARGRDRLETMRRSPVQKKRYLSPTR